jgi:hypothetical protein
MNPLIQFKTAILTFLTAFAWFALSLTAQAQGCPSLCDNFSNTAFGFFALSSNNSNGRNNTATGDSALQFNTTGSNNTATGASALINNNADNNTADGVGALNQNTTGDNNTAAGADALAFNSTGHDDTATGAFALMNNNADFNTATGVQALQVNSTGSSNTATGVNALLKNTAGSFNTTNGVDSLESNTTGNNNTANGYFALNANKIGNSNTANGFEALQRNTGSNNTAEGFQALAQNTTGGNNIALGNLAGHNLTTSSNNIDIGNVGVAGEAAKIRIGTAGTQTAAFIAGIHGVAVTGTPVVVSTSGQLGVATSSARFKEQIKPMNDVSDAILKLKPVSFRYKEEVDPDATPQFGLVAEEVEKVSPDLVIHDEEGRPFTVRYDAVNAMLLNEFLKEHRKVADLEKKAVEQDSLKATIAAQQKQIEAMTAGLQKVTARLESGESAQRVASGN